MTVKYHIMAKTGEDGNGKAFYSKIGVVIQGDKGFSMRLNTVPLGWDGFAFFADPEQQGNANRRPGRNTGASQGRGGGYNRATQEENPDDDIPF